jgi:acyl-CoA thioesterase I
VNRRTLLSGGVAAATTLTFGIAAAGAATAAAAVVGTGARPPSACGAPPDLLQVTARLSHLARRVRARLPVTIVAMGGASTRGAAAGVPENAYPHRLQLWLNTSFPGLPLTVINKGVPRQSAQEMVARFPVDVFGARPVLVVWEVGIVDAVRGVEIDDFAAALQTGIDELKKWAIDSVLVDMQFSRRANTVIDFERYLETVHQIGELNDVYVFPRYALMRFWSEQHMFDLDEVAAGGVERARLAASVYDCIGHQLAEAIRLAAS